MTKAALIHLVRSLAVIAAPNIRVNSVAPGVLLTVRPFFPQDMGMLAESVRIGAVSFRRRSFGRFRRRTRLSDSLPRRFVSESLEIEGSLTPSQDVADQVRFLVMSSSITGQNIVIDAGFSL